MKPIYSKLMLSHAIALALFSPFAASAADLQTLDKVEVTTSKTPHPIREGAASVSVVTGDDLRARGATDLRTALSLVSGVDVAPGGDGGPASSVPALRGLREFDAFLLLVDGVPAGGSFVPALSTQSLANVERIEVLKGAAPVSYGATSFVGVINIIHYAAGEGPRQVEAGIGSRGGTRLTLTMPITSSSAWKQSLTLDTQRQDLIAERAGWRRAHALYRGGTQIGEGAFTADVELAQVRQDPNSPSVREGSALTTRAPRDANHNPSDGRIDENRGQLSLGYALPTAIGQWQTRLAVTRTTAKITRGFLRADFATDGIEINADGYRQRRSTTDIYFDTHIATAFSPKIELIWGADYVGGKGEQRSANFEYAVRGDGRNAPSSFSRQIDEFTRLRDDRDFGGVYADLHLAPTDAWRVEAGIRYNHTSETRKGQVTPSGGPADPAASDRRNESRWSGAFGSSYRFWQSDRNYVTGYVGYRKTFKPAVVDFGPEAEGEILKPETATTREFGVRGALASGRFTWEMSAFRMDFKNLVVTQDIGGSPGLINAGAERFDGAELEAGWKFTDNLSVNTTYAYHDARFGDYVQLFGSTPTQLRGKQLEMSPQHLSSLGFLYAPTSGINAYVTAAYVGKRYLNKRNTAPTDAYTTLDAGVGFRTEAWEFRVDGTSLTNRREPVSESELGDAQYYLLPARSVSCSVRYSF